MEEQSFFSTDGFAGKGQVFLWKPEILWLHVVSDTVIFLAFLIIPLTLLYFLRVTNRSMERWVFLMFSLFISLTGLTHLMNVWTVWNPSYALEGILKSATAAVSIVTALLFIPIAPKVFRLRHGSETNRENGFSKTESP